MPRSGRRLATAPRDRGPRRSPACKGGGLGKRVSADWIEPLRSQKAGTGLQQRVQKLQQACASAAPPSPTGLRLLGSCCICS